MVAAGRWRIEEARDHFRESLLRSRTEPWRRVGIGMELVRCALLLADTDEARARLGDALRDDLRHCSEFGGRPRTSQSLEGQLLDEYEVESSGLRRLRQTLGRADEISALAQLVLENPDYTPAAIGFLVALRRKDLFDRPIAVPRAPSPIPMKIAQYWDSDIPPDVEALCKTWSDAAPSTCYTRFSQIAAVRFLEKRATPQIRAAFERAAQPAMKADLFRLAYLYFEGGYYADADDRLIAPLANLDPGGRSLILWMEPFGTVGNNFIGAVPRHPVIGSALKGAVTSILRGDRDLIWLSTGPGLLTRAVAGFLALEVPRRVNQLWILDRHELSRRVSVHCMTNYKHSKKNWNRSAFRGRTGRAFPTDRRDDEGHGWEAVRPTASHFGSGP
jgi:mannosyltransferase OCH1-like enzyme